MKENDCNSHLSNAGISESNVDMVSRELPLLARQIEALDVLLWGRLQSSLQMNRLITSSTKKTEFFCIQLEEMLNFFRQVNNVNGKIAS